MIFICNFGHGDDASATNEMTARPVETTDGFKVVATDDTFDAGRRLLSNSSDRWNKCDSPLDWPLLSHAKPCTAGGS